MSYYNEINTGFPVWSIGELNYKLPLEQGLKKYRVSSMTYWRIKL
jgi:hypothetical protein